MEDMNIIFPEGKDTNLQEYYDKRRVLYDNMSKETPSTEEIVHWYNSEATTYETQFEKAGYTYPRLVAEAVAEVLKEKNGKILDVPAGTGKVAAILRELGFTGVIDGVDGAPKMLEYAKEKNIYTKLHCTMVGTDKIPGIEDDRQYKSFFQSVRDDTSDPHNAGETMQRLKSGLTTSPEYLQIYARLTQGLPTLQVVLCPSYSLNAAYDAVCCGAGLLRGHFPLNTIPAMLRAVKPNGYFVFNHQDWSAKFEDYNDERFEEIFDQIKKSGLCISVKKRRCTYRPGEMGHMYFLKRGNVVLN